MTDDRSPTPRQLQFLAVPGPCDLCCVWCNHRGTTPVTLGDEVAAITARLEALAARDRSGVGFGLLHTEPTTHPDLLDLVRRARDLGFRKISLSTSGMRLADRGFAREVFAAGVTDVVLTLVGVDPRRSDLLLGVHGATRAKLDALAACLAAGIPTTAVLMLLRPALRAMPETARHVAKLAAGAGGALTSKGCLMDLVPGATPPQYELLWPTYAELAWSVASVRAEVPGFVLHARDLPRCVAEQLGGVVPTARPGSESPDLWTKPAETCRGCEHEARCPGFPRAEHERSGVSSSSPIPITAAAPPSWEPDELERDLNAAGLLHGGGGGVPASRSCRPEWQAAVVDALAVLARRQADVCGLAIGEIVQDRREVRVMLGSDDQRLEAIIELRAEATRFLFTGSRFAISYSTATPADSPRKHSALKALLEVLDRLTEDRAL